MKIARKIYASILATAFMVAGITSVTSFSENLTPKADAQPLHSVDVGEVQLKQGVCASRPWGWSTCTDGGKAIWGWDKNTKIKYSWSVVPTSYGKAAVQVRGFNSRNKEQWYSAGMGFSGSRTVPWGNTIAYKKIKAQSLMVPLFVPVSY